MANNESTAAKAKATEASSSAHTSHTATLYSLGRSELAMRYMTSHLPE
jgi:hypothetical protein